jgi:methionine synthase I (cobalamin-dependent)
MNALRSRLAQPGCIIADGAAGTMLQRAGLPTGVSPEEWNLTNPEAILKLHRDYVEVGAEIILTNSFGGSPMRLERAGLGEKTHAINLAAARLAREAAAESTIVFGDIGPSGEFWNHLVPSLLKKRWKDLDSKRLLWLREASMPL